MSNLQDYEVKIDIINAIRDDEVKAPYIPVDVYVQEAENLYSWCQEDRDKLTEVGLDWNMVEDLPVRAGALRQAESRWFTERFTREEAQRKWKELSPGANDLRNTIVHAMTYAYRKNSDLAGRVSAIRDGSSHADMIQDLNDIAVLGKKNPEPLKLIKFDMALLDEASKTADEMAALLATSTSESDTSEVKKIRDKAYTHLKEVVDEIRQCGQFVFWRDKERARGYGSAYHRRLRGKKTKENIL